MIAQVVNEAMSLEELTQQLEDDLIANIARRIRVDDEGAVSGIDNWYMEKLHQLGALHRENVEIIARSSPAQEEALIQAIQDAGYGAVAEADRIFRQAYRLGRLVAIPVSASQSPQIRRILDAVAANARQELNLTNTTALQSSRRAYLDAVNQAYLSVVTGTRDYGSAIRHAVQQLGERGIKGATYQGIDRNGRPYRRQEQLDVAVRRNVLTSSAQVTNEMQLTRAQQWGSDLVEVSSHVGARPSHAEWQGRIYSISGKSRKYPSFYQVTGYGTAGGLGGVNCGHTFYPYFEGVSERAYRPVPMEENNRVYAEAQRQRQLERDIRSEKRKIVAADAAGDDTGVANSRRRLAAKQAEMREHVRTTGRTRRPDREHVAGVPRSSPSKGPSTHRPPTVPSATSKAPKPPAPPVVRDAKTHSELEQVITQRYSAVYDSGLSRSDFDAVKSVVTGFTDILDEYPDLIPAFTEIAPVDRGVMCMNRMGRLGVNPRYFTSMKNLEATARNCSASRFWPANATPASIGAHEAGHLLESIIINRNATYTSALERSMAWSKCTEAKRITRQAWLNVRGDAVYRGMSKAQITQDISRYATKSASECLAEAVADVYTNGTNAKRYSQAIVDIIRKELAP
ncbi:MAG: hypothetical protein QM270_07030 [Bacillota bacterium]|nr:hypothetical protein [Bacillota bacterium]